MRRRLVFLPTRPFSVQLAGLRPSPVKRGRSCLRLFRACFRIDPDWHPHVVQRLMSRSTSAWNINTMTIAGSRYHCIQQYPSGQILNPTSLVPGAKNPSIPRCLI